MSTIEIITDGSYARKNVGIGYVRLRPEKNNGRLGFTAQSNAIRLPKISKYGSQGAEALAVISALNELNEEGYNGYVIIYCDCNSITDHINGERKKFAEPIKYIEEELDICISRHSSVKAFHPKVATHLPKYLSAIAHNASAMASGAKKREKTTPEYTGKFSSTESNLLTRKAFHKAANQDRRQRHKKRGMAPSL
jgi:ribonuclease HI